MTVFDVWKPTPANWKGRIRRTQLHRVQIENNNNHADVVSCIDDKWGTRRG